MTPIFKKLNLKENQLITVLNAPDSFQRELKAMKAYSPVEEFSATEYSDFIMVFVYNKKELDTYIKKILPCLKGDAILWFCYPKKTSKKYTSDIHRDTGWEKLADFNYRSVRQVAIDEDWSALRFRNRMYMK